MSDLNKRDIEALLGGRAPDGLEQLAALLARVRQEASASVDPGVASRHIAAAATAARETPVPTPAPVSTTRRTWRRRTVFAGLLSTIFGKVFMGAVALAAVTAGAGAAGVLPDPVQGFVDGNQEIHRIADEIREQAVLHEQEPAGDQVHIRDRDQLQVNQPEQPGEPGDLSEPSQNQFQNQFQHQPVEPPEEPNQFQHEFQHHLGTMAQDPIESLLQYQNWFQWQWMYQGGDETTGTTAPQMHQQQHQQGIDQGTNTTLPQMQQQTQQQGLGEHPDDSIDQQQQQQHQQSTGETTGATAGTSAGPSEAGSSQDVPGGFGRP